MKRAILFVCCLTIITFCLWYYGEITPTHIRHWVQAYGAWAPLIFVGLFCLSPFAPFLGAVLGIAGGMAFGLWQGSLLVFLGSLGSCTMAWAMVQQFGPAPREAIKKRIPPHLLSGIQKHGLPFIVLLRLVPLIPFDLLSYGSALAGVKFRDILLGTAVGVIPGTIVYANIGAQSLDVHSAYFYVSIGLLCLLCVVSWLLKNRLITFLDRADASTSTKTK